MESVPFCPSLWVDSITLHCLITLWLFPAPPFAQDKGLLGLWSEGKCQLQDPAFRMQNQVGKGVTGQETARGREDGFLAYQLHPAPKNQLLALPQIWYWGKVLQFKKLIIWRNLLGVLVSDVLKCTDRCVSRDCALNVLSEGFGCYPQKVWNGMSKGSG